MSLVVFAGPLVPQEITHCLRPMRDILIVQRFLNYEQKDCTLVAMVGIHLLYLVPSPPRSTWKFEAGSEVGNPSVGRHQPNFGGYL